MTTSKRNLEQQRGLAGITRLELVVIGLIVTVLASIAFPFCSRTQITAKMSTASSYAYGIFLGLSTYAADHGGRYPAAENNSNEAFRQLIPDYLDSEKPFYVAYSAWHQKAKGGKPDNDIGARPDHVQALERGENHWAYVSGLNIPSLQPLPIVADGFSETVGVYTNVQNHKGGRWKGTRAIVIYTDGQARPEPLDPKTFKVMKTKDDKLVELFSSQFSPEIKEHNILNPEG